LTTVKNVSQHFGSDFFEVESELLSITGCQRRWNLEYVTMALQPESYATFH